MKGREGGRNGVEDGWREWMEAGYGGREGVEGGRRELGRSEGRGGVNRGRVGWTVGGRGR